MNSNVAYFDEAQGTGLKRVSSIDENGSAEWFILSVVLVAKRHVPALTHWVADAVNYRQRATEGPTIQETAGPLEGLHDKIYIREADKPQLFSIGSGVAYQLIWSYDRERSHCSTGSTVHLSPRERSE